MIEGGVRGCPLIQRFSAREASCLYPRELGTCVCRPLHTLERAGIPCLICWRWLHNNFGSQRNEVVYHFHGLLEMLHSKVLFLFFNQEGQRCIWIWQSIKRKRPPRLIKSDVFWLHLVSGIQKILLKGIRRILPYLKL